MFYHWLCDAACWRAYVPRLMFALNRSSQSILQGDLNVEILTYVAPLSGGIFVNFRIFNIQHVIWVPDKRWNNQNRNMFRADLFCRIGPLGPHIGCYSCCPVRLALRQSSTRLGPYQRGGIALCASRLIDITRRLISTTIWLPKETKTNNWLSW